jgi:hypothetical protein
MATHDGEATLRCARCDGPLPAPIESLAVVHGRDGEILPTCNETCLAGLVADLTGRPDPSVMGGSRE